MDDIISDFSSLSTDALREASSSNVPKPPPPSSRPPTPAAPKVSSKVISQFYKQQMNKSQATDKNKLRDRILAKLTKVEQYFHHFGNKLKGKYKTLKPETCTEEEVDFQLKLIEKELCSENAPKLMETTYLLAIKGFQIGNQMFGNPVKLMLDAPYSLADVAASEPWMERVRGNLMHLQIKHGWFETGPELQFMMNFVNLLLSVDQINKAKTKMNSTTQDFNNAIPEEKQQEYKNL